MAVPAVVSDGLLPVVVLTAAALALFGVVDGEKKTGKGVIDVGIRVHSDVDVIVAQKNGKLTLNCSVTTSFGHLEYQWFKNGQLIDFDSVGPRIRLMSNGSISFKKFRKRKRKSDEGVYACVVQNSKGRVLASQVRVQVATIAKGLSREPQSQEAYIGGVARFECAIEAFPAAIFFWQKAGISLPQNEEKYTVLPSGVLQINDLKSDDAGLYQCITSSGGLNALPDVVDSIRWEQSQEATLTIKPAVASRRPHILNGNSNVTAKVGDSIILECLVDGEPQPEVSWTRKDNQPLDPKFVSYVGRKNLKIHSVRMSDKGIYQCTARAGDQKETSTISVTLNTIMAPIITNEMQSQRWPIARSVILDCSVESFPTAEVRWYRNGEEVSGDSYEFRQKSRQDNPLLIEHQLIMYVVDLDYTGYFQCVAENSVGTAMAIARLDIYKNGGSPEKPTGLKVKALSSTKIFVQWNKAVTPEDFPIMTYCVLISTKGEVNTNPRLVGGENTTIKDLKPYSNYTIAVQAYNNKGASEKSQEIHIMTKESVPTKAPEITLSSSGRMIHVEWLELQPGERNGVITEYKVFYKLQSSNQEYTAKVDANKKFYDIKDIEAGKTYKVRVLASTKEGYPQLSDSDWPWLLITAPRVISTFPTPHLNVVLLNTSSVMVKWNIVDDNTEVERYDISLRSVGPDGAVIEEATITAPALQYIFNHLENDTEYEVTLIARGKRDSSGPVAMEFRTSDDIPTLPAQFIRAKFVNPFTMFLTWTQPGNAQSIQFYNVCYHEKDTSKTAACIQSFQPSATIAGLKPYTKYVFTVSTSFKNNHVRTSKSFVTQTQEDLPSAPTNISWLLVSPGTVQLQWKPPTSPNGIITSYIIFYNNNKKLPDAVWRNLTQTGMSTQATVHELTAASYIFKLSACTRAGQGRPSEAVLVNLDDCNNQLKSCLHDAKNDTVTGALLPQQIGIIIGVTIGIICIIICIIVIIFRNRCFSRREHYESAPVYHGNGHLSPQQNGHAISVPNKRISTQKVDVDVLTPMLTTLPENTESDSKGGGPLIVTANGVKMNGVKMNGINRNLQNGHVPNGHVTSVEGNAQLNESGSEEHHALIAAMLASTDWSGGGTDGSEMSVLSGASLDEIDHSLDNDSNNSGAPGPTDPDDLSGGGTAEAASRHQTTRAAVDKPPTLRNSGSKHSAANNTTSSSLPHSNNTLVREQGDVDQPLAPPSPLASSNHPSSKPCSSQERSVLHGNHINSSPLVGNIPQLVVRAGSETAGCSSSSSSSSRQSDSVV